MTKLYRVSLSLPIEETISASSKEEAEEKVLEMISHDPEGYLDCIVVDSVVEVDKDD